ncbi:MAG TPA: 5-(carboxyamino)imidazole ribonucleotide mutase [bacterium]|nr:5-(carboxyamino)imidazole ribonucleotide mutase [bacterium]
MATKSTKTPLVGIVMGSKNDLEVMNEARVILDELEIPCEVRVLSAHRIPQQMIEWAAGAEERGMEVLIAGAGMAAALPGMVAANSLLPVLGVPLNASLNGLDALLSIVQMPKGVPVGTLAIGKAGAANAGLLAARIIAGKHPDVRKRLEAWRGKRVADALKETSV